MQDLLQWAGNERRTGTLVVRRSRREKWIAFDKGWIVGCLSDHPAEFFGQYLILNDYLDANTLVDVLAYSKKHGVRLGASLSDNGILDEQTIQAALSRHIQDTVCDLFLWTHGVFFFREEESAASGVAPDPIDSMAVLLEGSRWIDEHARIRGEALPHDNIVMGSGSPAVDDLTPIERKIVKRVDGMATLSDIRRELRGTQFRVLEAAYRCLRSGLVQVIAVGEEPEVAGTQEVSLLDVLYEHAAEERVVEWSSDLALPIDLVETFYAVWVGDEVDLASAPGGLDGPFASGLDGQIILSKLFYEDADQRFEQYRWLIEQLKQHNIALLPMAVPGTTPEPTAAPESSELQSTDDASVELEQEGYFDAPEEVELEPAPDIMGGTMSGLKRWWKRVAPG